MHSQRRTPVVCLAYPGIGDQVELQRVAGVDSGIEVITCDYVESSELRSARRAQPGDESLREMAPRLDDRQRKAFGAAEVILALDVPIDLFEVAPRVRWIHAIGSGVGQYAGLGLDERGVVLTNSAGVGATAIAEFVLGRVLMLWKDFPALAGLQAERRWEPRFGRLLQGCTIGVVGLGAIGSAVAARAQAFGMRVLAVRRTVKPDETSPLAERVYGPDGLHEVLAASDVVVVAAAATPETDELIDAAAIAAMKPGALLCNVARGSLVDEVALAHALRDGRLGAAVVDVAREEPLPPDNPLWDAPNIHISAHCSASQDRYFDLVFELFLDNLSRYVAGQPLRNVVDLALGY